MSTSVSGLSSNFFPEAENGFTTTTAGSVSSGASTVTLNSVSGYTNGAIAVFVIDPTDAAKKQTFTGVIDTAGVQVTSVVWTAGTNQTHALGATVVDYATATHISMITKGLLAAGLNQGGTMTPKVLTSINDVNGNEAIRTPATASAVNDITVTNAATGGNPSISASGSDSTAHLNLRGKGLAKTVTIGAGATTIFPYDYVVSGLVITGTGYGSTLAYSMTSGVVVINGNPITVASATGTVTASRDTYFDILDNGDGTGLLVNTSGNIVTNNAASPALASNSIRIGIIVSGANIASVASINQGQEDKLVPITSSTPYAVTDSLGNLICPRDPNRKVIGQRLITSNFATAATSSTLATGLTVPVIIPTGRKVRVSVLGAAFATSTNTTININIWEGTVGSGTVVGGSAPFHTEASSINYPAIAATPAITPSSSSITYNVGIHGGAGTTTLTATSSLRAYVLVELV